MFVDRTKIKIKGGNGGNGCVSFYRAKYITNGGPDGGDGGRGGDIIFVADRNLSTLMDFRYTRTFKAEAGKDGKNNHSSGKDGTDVIVKVPVGTIIREANSNKIMADLTIDGEKRIIIRGGRGGRGNQHYATSTMQAPRYAQSGQIAKEYEVILELKLIADVGLVGFPNVGKSSILKMVTNANPKIANYHFTTLAPNLGVVKLNYGKEFVLADIPGIIEGANEGLGLGFEFLRHIERTKVLIYVVDASALEGGDPLSDLEVIRNEISIYNPKLMERPQIIAANKNDLIESASNTELLKEKYEPDGIRVFSVSAATGDGLAELVAYAAECLENYPQDITFVEDYEEYEEITITTEPFEINRNDSGWYVVTGAGVEKMVGYTNMESEKGFNFFQKYMRDTGIIAELERLGIEDGETVQIYDMVFDYYK